jgi:hypothetical protein
MRNNYYRFRGSFAGSEPFGKFFNTDAEALEYADSLSDSGLQMGVWKFVDGDWKTWSTDLQTWVYDPQVVERLILD